ncbi:MAG: serine/threonine protein kinase [Pyrinomonadaceae bacterium]|nr:serine/threonine protein kinase [Pyrinomonadaceae bacterium]
MSEEIIGKILVDKYKIESILKRKQDFLICAGKQILLDKPVLIKLFFKPSVNLITQEIRSLATLPHPNIAGLIDYGEQEDGTIFLITEAIKGKSLKQTILENGFFELEKANDLIQQISSALIAAHANGVVHGRLNSEDIYVATSADGKDFVKISGFGLIGSPVTMEEAFYLAPEQFSKNDLKDTRSDIYSLGIIAYELLTGHLPFSGKSLDEVMQKHLKETPPPISHFRKDIPSEIEEIIRRALAKSPDNRFQTVKGFAENFDFAVKFAKKLAHTSTQVAVPKNNPWKTAFIVFSGIMILGSLFIYLTQVKQTEPPTLPIEANSIPVQPLNPATGMIEQSLSNMSNFESMSNMIQSNMKPEVVRSNDSWSSGAFIPPPSTQYYDGNVNPQSPFMASDGNVYIIVPKASSNSNSNQHTKPETNKSAPKASPTSAANLEVKPQNKTAEPTLQEPKNSPKPTPSPTQNLQK